MTQCKELWVDRSNFRNTKIVSEPLRAIDDGEQADRSDAVESTLAYALS